MCIRDSVLPDTERPTFNNDPSTISDINCGDVLPIQETLTASDGCGEAEVTPSVDPFTEDLCNGYIITYRWTAEDKCGNTAETTESFNVARDNVGPIFDRAPSTIADISCNDPLPTQETLTATDACGTTTVTPSVDPFIENLCGGYQITYRWTATDDCGNNSVVTSSFNVIGDNQGPTMTCIDDLTLNCEDLVRTPSRPIPI